MIDLRSDTITLPSPQMLDTIHNAKLGDDGRRNAQGLGEDETVNELERLAAEITGKEAAVLFPSGTLANTAALYVYCNPGEKVLIDSMMHMYASEKVAFDPRFGRLKPLFYNLSRQGIPDLEDIGRILEKEKAALLCVECSHNFAGGTCIPLDMLNALAVLAKKEGIPIHMDGARLFNAACALNVKAKQICQYADSVMFCLSKGLGAPIGSMVCGEKTWCNKVRKIRKLLGGTMRQAGVIAAPAIYALKHNIDRLKQDHANAQRLATSLNKATPYIKVIGAVQTNMVRIDVSGMGLTSDEFLREMAKRGVRGSSVPDGTVRLVFHKDVSSKDAEKAAALIIAFIKEHCQNNDRR